MKLLNRHRHEFTDVFSSLHGRVVICINCRKHFTYMWDYNKKTEVRVEGNFLYNYVEGSTVYILCADILAFKRAALMMNEKYPGIIFNNRLQYLDNIKKFLNENNPVIFFFEDWWENEIIQHPAITKYLNKWL